MPPKGKGKKGKKGGDDDEYWNSKEAEVDAKLAEDANGGEAVGSGSRNAFDMLDDDDDDEGGGLMSTINKQKTKPKKTKAKKAQLEAADDEIPPPPQADTKPNLEDEWPEDDVKPKKGKKAKNGGKVVHAEQEEDVPTPVEESAAPTTAVNLEDEWPEEDVKPKKGKRGKKAVDEEEDDVALQVEAEKLPATASTPEPITAAEPNGAAGEDDEADTTIMSKAQKERLKKEKERAKKKAQAAAKKTGDAAVPTPAAPVETAPVAAEPAGGAKGAKGKKASAHILAMQAAMEEKKRIEEEAERVEAERIRKIEEEDARIAAEEERIAEQKAAKKAKEKEKAAKAKADGRSLTPAQKKEKAAAEARKQAMLNAAGMSVAGLQVGGGEKKKPVYSKKKGKGGAAKPEEQSAPDSPMTAADTKAPESPASAKPESDEGGWDQDDEAAVEEVVSGVNGIKVHDDADWDVSDEEPAEVETSHPAAVTVSARTTPANPTPTINGKLVPGPNGRPASDDKSSDDEDSSDEDDGSDEDDESSEDEAEVRKTQALARIQARQKAAEAAKSKEDLRSPICCILGHVDTGKTKLLDKIRQTTVQEGEAGGITQQIGATFFPKVAIQDKTAVVNKSGYDVQIPGLLIIDTPGHESFANLRTRGSSLCNIAILVVDITHGLEPQTLESLNLLRNGKTPFIVALNKIDRMYGWKPTPNGGFRDTLGQQDGSTKSEFEDRLRQTKLAFAEQGLNAELFDENKNLARTVSLVPTSAITGEGIPDMLMLLVKLTQERMNQSLMFISELECTILEVKIIEGLGTTIDVILSNGVMHEGDRIVLCGMDGPIVTNVRALLTPQPLRELRVKSAYVHHKEVKAALGVKISAPGLEKAIAGARLYVARDEDEVEAYKDLAMQDVNDLQRFASKGPGVWVQASTLGALEALLTFLQKMKIPVRNFAIGPVYRSHVLRAGRMLDVASEFALILAFDVPIDKDARDYADKEGVKIFSAMIIYHLFDAFTKYMTEVQEAKRLAAMPNAVWPVRLSIIKAFAMRDPIVLGVDIIEGSLRTGTPVGVVKTTADGKRDIVTLGKITSIEINHKPFEIVKRAQIGAGAAVKIERASYQAAKLYGRHFDDKDEVVSLISRQSIDTLKKSFRDQVDLTDWAMIKKMKVEQGIP